VSTVAADLDRVRALVGAALASLEASRGRIDDLNVYPVPDGDTGTNLTLTVRAVAEALGRSEPFDRPTLGHEVTRAALMGARGNSGVILSQIVRGAAEVLSEAPGDVDAALAARALRGASDAAYRAVRRPVEGTMLSVVRELAEEAERLAADPPPLDELLVGLVRRGEDAVAHTPEQLDVLREAGVVDAGGAGLVELLRGLASAVAGEEVPQRVPADLRPGAEQAHLEPSRYRYCTAFVVEGDALDAASLEGELDALGDSLLVVGDPTALKVHVHTDDPGAAISLGTRAGVVSGIEVANMREQQEERERRLTAVPDPPPSRTGVVAVVAGSGIRRLYESLAAPVGPIEIVEGGQSMNPSTSELVAAVGELGTEEAILLPNNANVRLVAEHAAAHAGRPVAVVGTDSVQAGLAALVAFDGARTAEENAAEMREAAAAVATGEVTVAARDSSVNDLEIGRGDWLGLVDGEPVVAGRDFAEVALRVVERITGGERSLLTLLAGAEAPGLEPFLERLAAERPELEVELHDGGQPHYQLLLSAE
jgi:DAK2 domain fusion protein YloV